MAIFANHDVRALNLIVLGVPVTEGRDSVFLKITKDEDAYGEIVGSQGETIRYGTQDYRYSFELTLMPSSPHNQELQVIHALDTESKTGAGVGIFLFKDGNGTELVASDTCWIVKQPDLELGTEPKPRVWKGKFIARPAQVNVGTLG